MGILRIIPVIYHISHFQGLTASSKESQETQIYPGALLENLNNAIVGIVKLDFRIISLREGLVQTRISNSLCHHLGRVNIILNKSWALKFSK